MRKADKNKDNKMTLKELKHFLRQINIEVDDMYAEVLFAVSGQLQLVNDLQGWCYRLCTGSS